ncbi:MAG: hypothetical protein KF824_13070 [Fimbriimonadaceae bacterium]|nr:MAG: hypothetical protein KF824_13070 [Fimbriimonadaceae bacterium]
MPTAMINFLLIFSVILAVFLLAGVVLMLRMAKEMRKSIQAMDARLAKLDQRLTEQQAQVNSLKAMLAHKPDPMHEIMNALSGFRQNGPAKTLLSLGSKLFAAYFKQRKVKALPERVSSEVQK